MLPEIFITGSNGNFHVDQKSFDYAMEYAHRAFDAINDGTASFDGSGDKLMSVGGVDGCKAAIPVYGNTRNAINDFQNGRYASGAVHSALAITDVFMVKSLLTRAGKLAMTGILLKRGRKRGLRGELIL